MEFPSFNHHNNRYLPPPPPNNFSSDLYPHNHHHHHLLRPPPPPPLSYPPPPPHPPLPVPPPPSSYNPHQSHFTFLNHSRSSPPPPRFSDQNHRFDYRTDSWSDPRRVLPEPPHRHPIFPNDPHRQRFYSPNPPSENYHNPRDLERVIPSSRYRDDGYARRDISSIVKQDQLVSRGSPNRYASAHLVSDVGKSTSSSSRNMEDFVEKYEPRYMTMMENERSWDRSDEDRRWVHATKGEKNEFDHGVNDVSAREQSRDYEYDYELSKFNRVREGREEFKQVQKKSVLLRIGKPNNTYRNRSHDQHFAKPYLVESNNSNFRGKDRDRDRDRDHLGKDSSFHLDQNMEGDRESSPVDLDVSFKSNALVAKAVVTPSSPVFDNNSYTQSRNRKIKRATEFDSPLKKFSELSSRSGSSSHGSECPSSSEKSSKQVIRDKYSVLDGARMGDSGGGSGGSDGPLSFRLRKKRKVINLSSRAPGFWLTEKDEKPVDGENVKNNPIVPIQGTISFPSLEELTVCKVDESPQGIVSEKVGSEFDTQNVSQGGTSNASLHNVSDDLVNEVNQQSGQDEVLLNLENDAQEVSLGGTGICDSSGQGQIEIQKGPTESYAGITSDKLQETSTAANMNSLDLCSDEIISVFPEKCDVQDSLDDVSRKEDQDETQLLESITSIPNGSESCIAGDTSKQTCFDGITNFPEDKAIGFDSSLRESSSEEDEVTETGKLNSESVQTPSPDHTEPSANLPPSSSNFSASADENGAFVTDPDDKSVESMPKSIVSSQKVSSSLGSHTLINKSTDQMMSNPSIPKNNESFVENSKTQGLNTKIPVPNLPVKKPTSVSSVPRVFAGHSSLVFTNSRIKTPANHITKPRTWHRSTSNPASSVTKSSSIPVPPPPKRVGTDQNSYIRTGNTLVRKAAPASGQIETRNSAGSGSNVHNTISRTGKSSAPAVRPKTPPLSGTTKLPDFQSSSLENLSIKGNCEEGNFDAQKVSEDQIGSTPSNSDSQKTLDEGNAGKKIQYVKRKSNQLVAASSSDQSVQDLDNKTQDGYYKRRKNQLIRTSVGDDSVNTDVQRASKINIKRQAGKGISKKHKHLRHSSVWTLNSQSLAKDGVSLRQKLRPHLFPWKRSRFWGNAINISTSIPNNDLSSSISRKLVLSRKRGMIYTKSRHGFSLRMSKLLSVGGSSLKWSKSIERNSKRANEEATLAVAAVEKKKREQHGSARATVETKSRNNMLRDRIFRIGLVRYKMDPSRRTLQRISDEDPSTSVQSKEREIRRSYVPKRLLIGHNEYVRIGNGNQLVRNPKRRTRIFANEKVRWSLHTARSRLAKKRKYCQFFTRFGKCNKDDGKCSYIHDSSKIAVCTKFLNGSCSNPDCKLTHKVIPERMQDCSYFSQGLCSNEHCPYRHVNVNSAASICEGFLKGYCADGNECRKKHTYACPIFEATGTCSQGTKCKLHHPKNRNTGLKRKQQDSMEKQHQNTRGRYFGSIKGSESMPVSEKRYLKDDDDVDIILCQEGKFADYISLDFSNEEAGDVTSDQRIMLASETLDLGAPDLDELTKPVRIMNR